MEKKILIVGCYHSMNSGVMAMAEAVIQRYPQFKIYVISSHAYYKVDRERYKIYPNVELVVADWLLTKGVVNKLKILLGGMGLSLYKRLSKVINEVDVILDISGDSISNDYGTKSIFFSLYPNFISPQKKIIYAPQTIGPFNRGVQEKIVNKAFKRAKAVYLREPRSMDKINSTNIKIDGIYADLAFLLEPRALEEIQLLPQRTIAVGVSALVKRFGRQDYIDLFKEIVDRCLEADFHVLLVNHVSTKQGNDILIAKELKNSFFAEDNRVLFFDTNFRASEWKYLIAQCSGIISARMHPVVHALASEVPALNLSYNHKSLGVVYDRFFPYGQVIDINDPNLISSVENFLSSIETFDSADFKQKQMNNRALSEKFFGDLESTLCL